MTDLILLLVVVAFFVLCAGYVRVCDSIVGPDPDGDATDLGDDDADQSAMEVTA